MRASGFGCLLNSRVNSLTNDLRPRRSVAPGNVKLKFHSWCFAYNPTFIWVSSLTLALIAYNSLFHTCILYFSFFFSFNVRSTQTPLGRLHFVCCVY